MTKIEIAKADYDALTDTQRIALKALPSAVALHHPRYEDAQGVQVEDPADAAWATFSGPYSVDDVSYVAAALAHPGDLDGIDVAVAVNERLQLDPEVLRTAARPLLTRRVPPAVTPEDQEPPEDPYGDVIKANGVAKKVRTQKPERRPTPAPERPRGRI